MEFFVGLLSKALKNWYTVVVINENFVILGTIIALIGNSSYLLDTVKGKIRPNRVSYAIWTIAPLVAFAAQIGQGIGIQSLTTLSVGVFPFLILIASYVNKKAEWKLTNFDLFCGFLSLIGLALWMVTKVGNIAIFFALLSELLAAIPTLIKSYNFPETESGFPWLAGSLNGLITLLTITTWSFAYYGFPLYIFALDIIIFGLVQFKLGKRLATV